MGKYVRQISYGLFLVLIVMQAASAIAASLSENSPFIPFDYVEGQEVPSLITPQEGGIELRGILDFEGAPKFSLYNPITQKSVWVNVKDKKAPYYIDNYDPTKKMVAVMVNGVRQQLQVSKPSDEAISVGSLSHKPVKMPTTPSDINKMPEHALEEENLEQLPNDEQMQKKKEMSEKVYEAFKKYVAEKKEESR